MLTYLLCMETPISSYNLSVTLSTYPLTLSMYLSVTLFVYFSYINYFICLLNFLVWHGKSASRLSKLTIFSYHKQLLSDALNLWPLVTLSCILAAYLISASSLYPLSLQVYPNIHQPCQLMLSKTLVEFVNNLFWYMI